MREGRKRVRVRCPGVAELRKLVLEHYVPLYIANVWMDPCPGNVK